MGGARPGRRHRTARADHLHELVRRLKAFVGRHGGAVCTSTNARAVLEWALGLGRYAGKAQGDKLLFFPDQHLGRNTGFALGYDDSDMRGVEPAPRPRRPPRGRLQGRHLPARGRATARSTNGSGPSTSTRSAAQHPRVSSWRTRVLARRVPASPTASARPTSSSGRRADAARARRSASAPRSTSSTGSTTSTPTRPCLARPAGLPVLDDVAHRPAAPRMGARQPRRRQGRQPHHRRRRHRPMGARRAGAHVGDRVGTPGPILFVFEPADGASKHGGFGIDRVPTSATNGLHHHR